MLAYGSTVVAAVDAAELLAADGHEVTVVNARFAKPIDREMVRKAFCDRRPVITVEDHSVAGGFGSAVLETACSMGLAVGSFTSLGLPSDRFVEHGSRVGQLAEVGIDAAGIASAVRRAIEQDCDPAAPATEHDPLSSDRSVATSDRILSR